MKDCPKCNLVNPDTAERCDCGYDFPTGTLQASYTTYKDRRWKAGAMGGGAFLFYMLWRFTAGLVGGAHWGSLIWVVILILGVIIFCVYRSRSRDPS